jgi:heme/copper-type cytochrome/quinol oxidase subunit 2
MFATGHVVSESTFKTWIAQQRQQFAPATKNLAPYRKQYFPDPQRRGG